MMFRSSSITRRETRVLLQTTLAALFVMLLPFKGPSLADEAADAARYQECMAAIEINPEKAFDSAIEWRDLGGGQAAWHCAAAALLALGYYEDAAKRLEDLAQQPTDDATLRAALLRQAAQGWSMAGNPERAFAALTAAIGIDEKDPKLFLERAVVHAGMGLYDKAVDDLSQCLALDPVSADAYTFRASAYRYLDQLELARADAHHALALEPNHLEARLERGILRRLSGDLAGARMDWTHILELAPNEAIAESARRNIELLDIQAE